MIVASAAAPIRAAIDRRGRGGARRSAASRAARQPPGQHLERDHAQRVDVDGGRHPAADHLLGRHVRRRAGEVAGAGALVALVAGQPEVGDHRAVAGEQHVARLEVAVDHARRVGRAQPRDQPVDDRPDLGRRQRPVAQAVGQAGPGHQLHRHVAPAVGVDGQVERAAHVRVGDRAGQRHLAIEAIAVAARRALRRQRLQRDVDAQRLVLGLVDLAHAAAAEQADDPVPASDARASHQHRAGRDRRRRGVELAARRHRRRADAQAPRVGRGGVGRVVRVHPAYIRTQG
jgi:hypothetical protein